jgi:peptidoglycan hydrolase CwlO-like protein
VLLQWQLQKINKLKFKKYVKITVMKKIITVILFLSFFVFWLDTPATFSQALSVQEKARLQSEYDALQKEIAEWQKVLDETKAKKNTLQGDVTILNAQIAKAEKEIKQRGITVTNLNSEINQKTKNISSLEARIENDKDLLANLLKKKDQNEAEPIFYLLLSSEDLSNLMTDIDNISSVNQGLQDLFAELRGIKTETQKEKEALAEKKNKELDAKYEVEVKKKQIAQNQTEKKEILAATTQAESNYQTVLADRQRRAEVIRSALFDLRDAGGISFAKALEYATYAGEKTGVRPAVILAILSQESDLGKNIGSCYVSNLTTGDGVGKNTGTPFQRVMYAPLPGSTSNRPSDVAVFESITSALGMAWATTPVSCPPGATYYVGRGFGGGMGPTQFIPSTWQGFVPRLKNTLGVSVPNPWDPKHAIMATAMYISDLGAGLQTYTAERNAACKYYSGAACTPGRKPTNTFYGDQVIAKAEKFQADIDFLKSI